MTVPIPPESKESVPDEYMNLRLFNITKLLLRFILRCEPINNMARLEEVGNHWSKGAH